ncbi:AMP-binding protein [Acetobacter sp. TBRC 12305]|uniref:AMP-binding protein n=1 Tax=Acetobacter garciniae TaxID=2817435 RepID=A0A939KQ43_9PROT|nr:AMP-binding protein [Acetobacter garciniae]MBX0344483.1 AMP-binding protein [Acetobacter garciniae]
MHFPDTPDFSLIHAPDRVVVRRHGGEMTGHDLLRAAYRVADLLPDAPVVPVCLDVGHFIVLLLATLLRGRHVLLSSDRTATRLAALAAEHGAVCVGFADDLPDGEHPAHMLVLPPPDGSGVGCPKNPAIDGERLVAIVFTSGSTGQPVAHTKRWGALVVRSIVARVLLDPVEQASTLVGTVPPYHMYGFETLVLQAIHTRCAVASGPAFYPSDWRKMLEFSPAPRVLVTTPLQLRLLLGAELSCPAIARIISAAAPLGETLARQAEDRLGAPVMEIYGATEIGSVAMRRTTAGPGWELYDTVELAQDGDDATIAAPGAPAYPLSDLVEKDGPRHFRLIGRRNDMVKLAAKRASLSALNTALTALPGVEDGAFLPPEGDAESAFARMRVFVVAPALSAEAVIAGLRGRIDPAFLPRGVVFVDALPRNGVGKLTVQALRQFAARLAQGKEIGTAVIPASHPCLAGHFPGRPVVPGVVLLEEGLALAGLCPTRIEQVKFLRPVSPDETVTFFAKHEAARIRLSAYVQGQVVLRAVIGHGPQP